MPGYSLGHLENHVLLRDLTALVTQDRATTATLLAHIGEVHARRLYADAGYGSMYHYCLGELGFSEDMAGKRVTAARVARRFPGAFDAIADGRLHLTALCLLSKPLRTLRGDAALELINAAHGKTNDRIRLMLAERSPQRDLAPRVRALPDATPPAPERVEVQQSSGGPLDGASDKGVEIAVAPPAADALALEVAVPVAPARPARTMPLSPGRFGLQLTMSAETHEKWRRAEELLAPAVPRGDYAQRLDRALHALIEKLERRRFGATDSPRAARPPKSDRHIPASVLRAVRARDGEQCTFESESGRRCEERSDLEYDHIVPHAKGGKSTVANLRLRCFAHNQLEAERAFGAGFMQAKRDKRASASRAKRHDAPPSGEGLGFAHPG